MPCLKRGYILQIARGWLILVTLFSKDYTEMSLIYYNSYAFKVGCNGPNLDHSCWFPHMAKSKYIITVTLREDKGTVHDTDKKLIWDVTKNTKPFQTHLTEFPFINRILPSVNIAVTRASRISYLNEEQGTPHTYRRYINKQKGVLAFIITFKYHACKYAWLQEVVVKWSLF